MGTISQRRLPTLCLVCGVDSGPIRTFLFMFFGVVILGSFLTFLWALASKRFGGTEMDKFAIEAEKRE